jgi:hypothetical protein
MEHAGNSSVCGAVPLTEHKHLQGIKQNQTLVEMGILFFEMPLVILVGCQLPTKLLKLFLPSYSYSR